MDPAQIEALQQHAAREAAGCPYAKRAEAEAEARSECPFGKKKKRATFNAQQQRISTSGEHAWVEPNFEAGDQRGPCPGLNALANHGYLPHNGVADMATIIRATNEVYGMSLDLGGFLAVYGTVFDGNPLSTNPGYSIGGPSSQSQNILNGLGLLGTPSGLSGSHNKYESDVSATRGDLYVTGNNFHVQRDRFIEYYNAIPEDTPAPEQYTALAPFHQQRFENSVSTNPYFFYSPFAGVLVSPAAYSFPPRMMANHSDEYPEGYLSRQTFATFFGVDGNSEANFQVNQGWERIPDNWYKRPIGDEFSIPDFLIDVLEHAAYYPPLLSIGGNTGTVNSFSGVDVADLTGGVFHTADLLNPDKLQCFVLQIIQAAAPDVLGSMFADVQSAMAPLTDKLAQLLAGKACPQLQEVNANLFQKYPGYTESYGSYAGLSKGTVSGVLKGITGIVGGVVPTGNKE
ncbi:uncharacterized protein B0I36DRAFT_243142 [Microdochium trichocladiopsis]|uniref:Heme haloperoxidase family profile domain-containing protein n=1 Tax=Microdochium trichocladiopsis TaxID=1682393 RepID=A0A9P8Y5H9_9PEZI|nr:uncharacterized protein B0I36DRAFT_243142 [Microdochium trichocladiopsis]KAH7030654.1 hypothetical protein B0I36DRAFT_243142 [Microdochium trichocladiopsis]